MSKDRGNKLHLRIIAGSGQSPQGPSRDGQRPQPPMLGADDIYSQTQKAIDKSGKLDPEVERIGKDFVNSIFPALEARVDAYRMNAISRNLRKELTGDQLCIEMTRAEAIISIASVIRNTLAKSFRNGDLGVFNNTTRMSQSLVNAVDKEKLLPDGQEMRPKYLVSSDDDGTLQMIRTNYEYFFFGPLATYASGYGLVLISFETVVENAKMLIQLGKTLPNLIDR